MKQKYDPMQAFKATVIGWVGFRVAGVTLPPELDGQFRELVAGLVAFGIDAIYFWLISRLSGPKPWIGLVLAFLLLAPVSAHSQTPQVKASYLWDSRDGWSEMLFFDEQRWAIRDVLGLKGFDLQPVVWGDPTGRHGGGGALVCKHAVARNLWLHAGPAVGVYERERPRLGLFVGFSLDVFGGR